MEIIDLSIFASLRVILRLRVLQYGVRCSTKRCCGKKSQAEAPRLGNGTPGPVVQPTAPFGLTDRGSTAYAEKLTPFAPATVEGQTPRFRVGRQYRFRRRLAQQQERVRCPTSGVRHQ